MAKSGKLKGTTNGVVMRSRRLTFLLFTIPGFVLYSLFFIYPVLMGIYYSLTDWDGIARKINFIGLKNYVKILTKSPRFQNSITFNLKYSAMYVVCILVLGIILALILNHKVKGITFFRATFFLPAVLCGVTVGLIFSQIFYRVVPAFGQALIAAARAGVRILCYSCQVEADRVTMTGCVDDTERYR